MENPASFDLNHAIQQWRENLAQSPSFRRENLNELESHLRDSATALQSRGLSEEEAFLVAVRRLGRMDALREEFGKVNIVATWRARALWMLAGMLVMTVAWDLSRVVSSSLMYFGSMTVANGFALGWLSVAGKLAALGLFVTALWSLATGRVPRVDKHSRQLSQRPTLFVVLLFCGVLLLKLAPFAFDTLSIRNLAPHALGQTFAVTRWFDLVSPVIFTVLMAVVLSRLLANRVKLKSAGRVATWSLVLPIAISIMLSSAQAQNNPPAASGAAPTDKRETATLDQAMTLWRAGKKDEATTKFLAVDFSRRPLFPTGSALNYTEAQFIALPQAARDKLAAQMNGDIRVLKEICAQVRDTGKSALSAGDQAKAEKNLTQLKKCGEALDRPDSLALLQVVGKGLKKTAAETSAAPKN